MLLHKIYVYFHGSVGRMKIHKGVSKIMCDFAGHGASQITGMGLRENFANPIASSRKTPYCR